MAKIIPISEHFQHFVEELREGFWGDLQARTQSAAQRFFDALSEGQRDRYMVSPRYSRPAQRQDYRNGYYERDFVIKFGTPAVARGAQPQAGFSAAGGAEIPASGRGCDAADPGGISARHLHPASGPGWEC
jgi:hypothetical protein